MFTATTFHRSVDLSQMLADVVTVLQECEEAVTACASVVFEEPDPSVMLSEVRRDMNCVDVLATTRRVLGRQTGDLGLQLIRAQVQSASIACEISYAFCSLHADDHTEARSCSTATRKATATLAELSVMLDG